MTLGETLYLAMVVVSFTLFGLVLAFYTHRQAQDDHALAASRAPVPASDDYDLLQPAGLERR